MVRFTYRERFETYGRPPDPANFFSWRGATMVVSEAPQLVVDDVVLFRDGSTRVESRLSEAFVGCDGPAQTTAPLGYRVGDQPGRGVPLHKNIEID